MSSLGIPKVTLITWLRPPSQAPHLCFNVYLCLPTGTRMIPGAPTGHELEGPAVSPLSGADPLSLEPFVDRCFC